jgi:hypothetical protein
MKPKTAKKPKKTWEEKAVKAAVKEVKKAFSKSKPEPKLSKADYVRSQPKLSAKQLVEAAKKAGIKLQLAYVYFVRSTDRTKAKSKPKKAKTATDEHFNFGASHLMPGDSIQKDKDFMKAVLSIGIGRAKQIIGLVDHFGLS